MSLTITETSDKILERLSEIQGPKKIDDWGGDIETVIKQAKVLPAIYLTYDGTRFLPKELLDTDASQHQDTWAIVVIDKSLRGQDDAATGCYKMIEEVRKKLIGYNIGNAWLWPLTESQVYQENGKLAYVCEYIVDIETEDL